MPIDTKTVHLFSQRIKGMQSAGLALSDATRLRVYKIVDEHRLKINDAIRRAATDGGKELSTVNGAKVSEVIRAESEAMSEEIRLALQDAQKEALDAAVRRAQMLASEAEMEGLFFAPSAELAIVAQNYSAQLVSSITPELMPQVNTILGRAGMGGITPFEAMQQIDVLLGQAGASGVSYQAERIVRTEVNRIYNVTLDTQLQSIHNHMPNPKALKKTWHSGPYRPGRRESHQAMDGKSVPFDEPFVLPSGARLDFPHDPMGPPEETINCGCGYTLDSESIVEALEL